MSILVDDSNKTACRAAEAGLQQKNCAALVRPAGTGKGCIVWELLDAHPEMRVLWVVSCAARLELRRALTKRLGRTLGGRVRLMSCEQLAVQNALGWVALAEFRPGLLVLDGWYGGRIPAPWGGLLRGAAVAATLVWVLSFSWGLALLARFTYRKSADALKNGLVLALRTPRAALLTLLLAVLPWAVLTGAPALFFYLLPFWLFVLPGASAWCIARAMRPAVTELEHKNNYYLDREENP